MKTILIAEDENITRYGLRLMIESTRDFQLVGEAADGETAVKMVESLKPDILLLDVMLPKLIGFSVARQAKQLSPKTKVLFLSSNESQAFLSEAQLTGASGYVMKGAPPSQLFEALREVCQSNKFFSPGDTSSMKEAKASGKPVAPAPSNQPEPDDSYQSLTSREQMILSMAAKGATSSEIADHFAISSRTVETHRANLMRKLKLRSQTELVLYAVKHGILKM